ncbi:MAG: prephenate dehydrogenase [Acholeplasmataceae bacterium]
MRIFIVGLGLIGASYAEGLHLKGHQIYAYNRSQDKVQKAINEGIVEKDNDLDKLSICDLVILSLYPKNNIEFIEKNRYLFKHGQMVTDVSGTKEWMMQEIIKCLPEGITYTSHHPMAGKEISGYDAKDYRIFKGANFVIVPSEKSGVNDENILNQIATELNFGKILKVDSATHDQLIAFTSQLTHVLAIALVNTDHFEETKNATGDSYRDLTRIAKINETMWTELFLENKSALLGVIRDFQNELQYMKTLIMGDEKNALKAYMKKAKEKRVSFDKD